jgi:hypothetical protein
MSSDCANFPRLARATTICISRITLTSFHKDKANFARNKRRI